MKVNYLKRICAWGKGASNSADTDVHSCVVFLFVLLDLDLWAKVIYITSSLYFLKAECGMIEDPNGGQMSTLPKIR